MVLDNEYWRKSLSWWRARLKYAQSENNADLCEICCEGIKRAAEMLARTGEGITI